MVMTSDLSDLPPLSVAQLHILMALADGDMHGHAIMNEFEVLTQGSVTMGLGTLYGTVTCTQFLPRSSNSKRTRSVSTTPLASTSPHLALPRWSPPWLTETVAEGTDETSTYDGLLLLFGSSPHPL